VASDEWVATRGAQRIEGNSLVFLQVNCRSILNKSLDFWNLVDTYNSGFIIGTESWFRDEIRKKLPATGKNKSVGPDSVSGEI
jgi:hypothetical protein